MHHVIIGNSAAGIGAVEGIRKIDNKSRITLISDEPYHTYSRPLISYYLAGKVEEKDMLYRDLDFYQRNKVETKFGLRVVEVNSQNNEIALENNEKIKYDNLLLATGGKPFIPLFEGLNKKGVYTFSKLDDVKALKGICNSNTRVVIIGAGLIGLKAAEALKNLQVDVTVVELSNRVLGTILDEKPAGIIQKHLESQQIKIIFNNTVRSINGDKNVSSVTLNHDTIVECDLVVIAIGVVPNVNIVKDTEIVINKGIIVDPFMRTNINNIYSAGDVCEGYDNLIQKKRVIPILPNAYIQGEIAGQNMAGKVVEFKGGFAMNSIQLFDLPIITAGIGRVDDPEFEILEKIKIKTCSYKKVILRDNKVVGFICINEIDRAGIITNLIKEGTNVSLFKDELLKDKFGYINFPKEYRKQLF